MSKDISARTLELTEKLSAVAKLDPATGVVSVPNEWYEQNLSEGLTSEIVAAVHTHDTHVLAATANVLGKLSDAAYRGDSNLTKTSIEVVGHGNNIFSAGSERKISGNTNGVAWEKHNHVSAKHKFTPFGDGKADLNTVKALLNEAAKDL